MPFNSLCLISTWLQTRPTPQLATLQVRLAWLGGDRIYSSRYAEQLAAALLAYRSCRRAVSSASPRRRKALSRSSTLPSRSAPARGSPAGAAGVLSMTANTRLPFDSAVVYHGSSARDGTVPLVGCVQNAHGHRRQVLRWIITGARRPPRHLLDSSTVPGEAAILGISCSFWGACAVGVAVTGIFLRLCSRLGIWLPPSTGQFGFFATGSQDAQ